MKRFENWPSRLAAAIEASRGRAFSWGEHDCLLFAAGVVRELTGVDLAADWRGRYDSKAKAAHYLAELGGLDTVVTRALGAPRPFVTLAQRGDVVMVQTDEGPALGICNGASAACAGRAGLVSKPMGEWLLVWKV